MVVGAATLLPAGRPYHAVYWTKRHEFVDIHTVVAEALPTVIASAAQDVMPDGRILGVAWEPVVGQDAPVQWSWVFDPRHGALDVLGGGDAEAVTAWAAGGKKYIAGYLHGDWLFDAYALDPLRPAFWVRKKVKKEISWELTPIEFPEDCAGFAIWELNEKGGLVGVGGSTDGEQRAYYVAPPTRQRKQKKGSR